MMIKSNRLILFCAVMVGVMSQVTTAMEQNQNQLIRLPYAGNSPTKSKKEFEKDYNHILQQNAFRLSQMSYETDEEKKRAIDSYIIKGNSDLEGQLYRFYYTTSSTATTSSIEKSR